MANGTNDTVGILQIPPGLYVFFIVLKIFLSITSTVGSVLILVALRNVSSIHPPTKLLFRCLAVADLCVALICQPLDVFDLLTGYLGILYGIELIYAYIFFVVVLILVSSLTSAAISVDRLLALLLGLRYRRVVTLCRVRAVMGCVWLTAVLNASLFCMAIYFYFVYRTLYLASLHTFIVLILFSIVISTFSYTKIFFTLRCQQAQVQHHATPEQSNGAANPLNIPRYKKTVSSIAWIQFAMLICYGPFTIMQFLRASRIIDFSTETYVTVDLTFCLLYLNSSLNPVLYCWRIRDVRQEVKKAICKCSCCCARPRRTTEPRRHPATANCTTLC